MVGFALVGVVRGTGLLVGLRVSVDVLLLLVDVLLVGVLLVGLLLLAVLLVAGFSLCPVSTRMSAGGSCSSAGEFEVTNDKASSTSATCDMS